MGVLHNCIRCRLDEPAAVTHGYQAFQARFHGLLSEAQPPLDFKNQPHGGIPGIVIPTLLGLIVDLYIILPIWLTHNSDMVPRIQMVDMWSLSIVYAKIASAFTGEYSSLAQSFLP